MNKNLMAGLFRERSPEEVRAGKVREANRTLGNPNSFSKWYPFIKDCGIKSPKSEILKLTVDQMVDFTLLFYKDRNLEGPQLEDFDNLIMKPFINESEIANSGVPFFIKSSVYSNKFNFESCIATKENLAQKTVDMFYESVQTIPSYHELVLREFIEPKLQYGSIYNGMVLRSEFRVFYDFDTKELLAVVNYWDYETMIEGLHKEEDRDAITKAKEDMEFMYEKHKDRIGKLVAKHMKDVDLKGRWSVDIMMNSEDEDDVYLIDMALANESFYHEILEDK